LNRIPRISRLARLLEEVVEPIKEPILQLEQYTTPSHIALEIAADISYRTRNPVVADLGAGTCRLALAALLLGASRAIAVDVDARFPSPCKRAARALGLEERMTYVISYITREHGPLQSGSVDVVITNPPFGVHRRGADWDILGYALSLRPRLVYAILKSGNYEYHRRVAGEAGYDAVVMFTRYFPIPASMRHHRSRMRRVKVDVIRFE